MAIFEGLFCIILKGQILNKQCSHLVTLLNNNSSLGSGCDSVGRANASDTRGMQFDSSNRQQQLYITLILPTVIFEKTKLKKKEAGNGPFKKPVSFSHFLYPRRRRRSFFIPIMFRL